MIDMGTTAAVDTSQVNHTPEHSDAGVRALQESGLRVVYAYSRGAGAEAQYPQDLVRLRKAYFTSEDQLLTLALGGNLDRRAVHVRPRARRAHGRPTASATTPRRRCSSSAKAKLLEPGDEYIHCTHLSSDAWRLLKDTGGQVSLAVPIEMAMGHGMPPIQEALDHGIRPSLSSDVDVTMAQDPFTVMRACFTLQRLNVLQRARRGEQNLPPLLTTREVLEFATIEGARCTRRWTSKIGTLTPGKEADIVMLATDRLNVWPLNNVPGAVVNLMNPMNVDTVFIAGKVKKWRGSLVGVDVARVLRAGRGGARRRDRRAPASRPICLREVSMHRRRRARHDRAAVADHLGGEAMGGAGRRARAVAGKPRREIGGIEAVAGREWYRPAPPPPAPE